MTLVRVVPCEADVLLTVDAPLVHVCPYVDEVDEGRVAITWRTRGATFELHSLREWLDVFAGKQISHEELTDLVAFDLETAAGLDVESVTTTWVTAGMEVKCSTSPTRQHPPCAKQ